ncbi:fat-body protein 1 [Drosophila novamexicana]|uniref:fat-body protein 1 n=1 Tax=Drosophila novamexicana TaxID=47314 RepID=UPI0011E5EEB0|nr:fat-body protein 1 [Drosophila novamexicana]
MNKLLVLVACVLGSVSAGRILQRDWQVDQRIERMSRQDLQRQKFLLDIVQRVQQPLQQDDLIQLDRGLIVEPQRYRGGIDGEMQRVIDLDRQRRLLDEHQIYSIRNVEHVQQLRGIYRLLVRALDFETLQRNVIYLRRNINPVLLINALTLAIRDREDTQILIMPAVQEILPELYLDQQTIEQVQRMQSEVEGSPRPSLMDLVGLGQRMRQVNPVMRMVMPWRDLHMQMALRRQEMLQRQIQNRVVLPIQTLQGDQDISLLTEDIGLRNFMQNLIQELALLEDTTNARQMLDMENDNDMVRQMEVEQRRQGNSDINNDRVLGVNRRRMQQQQNEDDNESEIQRERVMVRDDEDDEEVPFGSQLPGSRVPLLRGIGQGIRRMLGGENLQTVSRNDERLVHINRRRLELVEMVRRNRQRKEQTEKERFMGVVRDDRLSEGRRLSQVQLEQDQISNSLRDFSRDEDWHRGTDNLQTIRRDDERLVHINRRRLGQPMENMTPRRISPIGEGRRVDGEDTMKVEDIMQLIRRDNRLVHLSDDEIIEMLRRNRQRKEQEKQQNEEHTTVEQGHRYRRSLVNPMVEQTTRRSEMILHTFRQLLARLNQERIAGRLGNDEMKLIDNSRLIMLNQDQTQRYAVRLNEMRLDSRRNRVLIEQINAIEGRLQQVIGHVVREMSNGNIGVNRVTGSGVEQIDEQLRIEGLIGDVLMGRLGNIGILRILRELLQDANVQLDRSGLGVSMGDRLLQHTLRRIISIVDDLREQQLGVYRREQLDMRDVTINAVRVGKLRTRIEDSDMDVSSLLEQPQQMQMMVRQRRLNNKPFTIDMDMSSERPQDVIVRLFLGPRQDATGREVNLEQRRSDFVLLDAINTQLQSGRNRIQYLSTNIAWTTRDATPYSEIYRRVMTTLRGQQDAMMVNDLVGENGRFPQRLLLPRGRPEGLPMQLLVIVSPMERLGREQLMRMERIDGVMGMSMASIMDSRPLGFPLDRRINNEQELLQLPNVQLEDVMIIHEN